MSKFGKKFTCWSCATKFYDLNKPNPTCPKCSKSPEDDPNKGMPPAPAAFGDDYDDAEEVVEEPAEEEDAEDEAEDTAVDDEF
jgi:hypothetical protein